MIRNNLLDNAKYFLIFLVVFGHLIEPLIKDQEIIKIIYMFIYSFHMPAFVVISGMLSKADLQNTQVLKMIKSILIPLIAFTILYETFDLIVEGTISHYTINLRPYWILWFLYSLFIWKLFLPIILNFKLSVLIVFFLALGAGYFESIGYFLGLSRTIYFFPFFILGYKLTPKVLIEIKEIFNSNFGTILLLLTLLLNLSFFSFFYEMQHEWLYGSFSYSKLGTEGLAASGMRILFYGVSTFATVSVLLLIPNGKNKHLIGGENSLYVYVWHGFFIKALSDLGAIYAIGELPIVVSLIIFFIISVILTKLLSSNFIAKHTTQFILNPVLKLLLIKS